MLYARSGNRCVCNGSIGSTLNKLISQSSSVVMAHWPSYSSNINTTDYSRMSVGIVQYFLKHTVTFKQDSLTSKYDHVFAFVKWRKLHENVRYHGISVTAWSVYICAILASKRLVNRISGKNLFLYMYNTKNFGNYCISPCCFVNILLYFM